MRTVKRLYYGVKRWCTINGVNVDWDMIDIPKVGGRIRDRIPTHDELRKILDFANIRDRAMILTLLSSGLRVGTLIQLKVGDVDFDSYEHLAVIHIDGGEGRKLAEEYQYITFTTPEAKRALLDYLEWRRRNGETIDAESPLITLQSGGHYRFSHNVSRRWRTLLKKAGLIQRIKGGWSELHLHTLRKFFQTQCKGAGISPSFYDFWMGHTTSDYLDDAYWREALGKHIAEYEKAIPHLSIFEGQPVRLQKRIEELEKRLEALKRYLDYVEPLAEAYDREHPFQAVPFNNSFSYKWTSEDELIGYLNAGWEVYKTIKGKILIRKAIRNP